MDVTRSPTILKRSLLVMGLLFGAYIGYVAYLFATTESRLRATGAAIEPGMRLERLQEFASSNGLGPKPRRRDGLVGVAEIRTAGRFGCDVEMQAGVVQTAHFQFAD
jgi:hypothetical protein